MTELFTLIALGAAFGWIFSRIADPPLPSPDKKAWPDIKVYDETEKIRGKIRKAEEELNNNNYFSGLQLFKELREELKGYKDKFSRAEKVGIDSSIKLCLEQVAESLLKQKVYKEALFLLREALTISPEDTNILKKVIRINLLLEENEEAIRNLETLLTLDPLFLDGYRRLGSLYMEKEETEKAIKIFHLAIDNFSEEKRVRSEMLERIALSTPRNHSAKLKTLKLWTEDLIKEKNFPRAGEVVKEALEIFPENISLKIDMGKINYEMGHLDKAIEEFETIKDNCPENLETKYYMGATYFQQNQIDRALTYLNQILNFEKTLTFLSYEEKIKRLEGVEIPGKSNSEILGSYNSLLYPAMIMAGEIYRRRGMLEEAEEIFHKVIKEGNKYIDTGGVEFFLSLSKDFGKRKDEREHYWKIKSEELGQSIQKKHKEKTTFEDFWLRFQPSEPGEGDIIGEGGMAIVYKGLEINTGREVAIKKMHRQFCLHPGAKSFFHKEVLALEALSHPLPHPNIVEFIAHGISGDRFVFAMELVRGKSLRDKLLTGEINKKEDIFSIICGICSGLSRAHEDEKRIVHRDLKPENVLITDDGTVKLTDFGICRVSSLSTSTRQHYQRTRSFVGTSYYSAPEQYPDPFDGKLPPIDHRADIYSLGCIIYEMLTTQTPFVHDDPGIVGLMHQRRKIDSNSSFEIIPPGQRNPVLLERLEFNSRQISAMDSLVMKCLSRSPRGRYQNVKEIEKELVEIWKI